MRAIQIKKNGGPEVLELKEIKLEKPNEDELTNEHKTIPKMSKVENPEKMFEHANKKHKHNI